MKNKSNGGQLTEIFSSATAANRETEVSDSITDRSGDSASRTNLFAVLCCIALLIGAAFAITSVVSAAYDDLSRAWGGVRPTLDHIGEFFGVR